MGIMSSSPCDGPRALNLEMLPIELWREIFTFACTDGGYTGRSLSLVSRLIYDTTEDIRYRSISVIGPSQIRAFFRLINSRRPDVCRHMHHLFLSDLSVHFSATNLDRSPGHLGTSKLERELRKSSYVLVVQILIALAPQLRTLTLFNCGSEPFRILPHSTPFPVLAELTCFFGEHGLGFRASRYDPLPLPALRRLHLIQCWQFLHPLDIAALAPALTHLRFSEECALPDSDLPTHLMALMGRPATPTAVSRVHPPDRRRPRAPLPPTVRRIVAHTQRTPAFESVLLDLHGEMLYELEHIAESDPAQRLCVLADDSTVGRRLEAAFADWVDRQEGREGCWELPDPSINVAV